MSTNNKATLLLCGSVVLSTALMARWFGLAVGPNRFGDVYAYQIQMAAAVVFFPGVVLISSWSLHLLLDSLALKHRGAVAATAKWVRNLPPALRILGEFGFALLAPVLILFVPMFLALPWWS